MACIPPGTVLRNYIIESGSGSDGFSIVYLARHSRSRVPYTPGCGIRASVASKRLLHHLALERYRESPPLSGAMARVLRSHARHAKGRARQALAPRQLTAISNELKDLDRSGESTDNKPLIDPAYPRLADRVWHYAEMLIRKGHLPSSLFDAARINQREDEGSGQ